METPSKKEKEMPEFKTVKEITEWTLDMLDKTNKKPFWKRESKYQKARNALGEDNWLPSKKIIEREYQSSEDVLETGRLNLALLHPNDQIPPTAPIVRHAVFWGILLQLVNQRVELTSGSTHKEQSENTLQGIGIIIATREYQKDISSYSVPQLLKELHCLASDMFKNTF